MNHEEQKLQMQCVSWFRAQYPQYAMLLTHPINEGGRSTGRIGGIHKAEGTQAGVPDLLLFMSATCPCEDYYTIYGCLGIEFKTLKGKQSQEQKDFQKIFEAAGNKYVVIRSFEEFKRVMNEYISYVSDIERKHIASTHVEIVQAAEQREKEEFYKIIGKK